MAQETKSRKLVGNDVMRIGFLFIISIFSVGCVSSKKYHHDLEQNFDLGMAYGLSLSLKTVQSQKTKDEAAYLIRSFIDSLIVKHGRNNG